MLTKRAAGGARHKAAPVEAPPTREAILDAAEVLFAERGVDGVAVRDLARKLSLTPSTPCSANITSAASRMTSRVGSGSTGAFRAPAARLLSMAPRIPK